MDSSREGTSGRSSEVGFLLHRLRRLGPADAALALLAAASLLLAVDMVQQKLATEASVSEAQSISISTASVSADGYRANLAARYSVSWSQVLQAISIASPAGARLEELGFATGSAEIRAIVKGEASDYDEAVRFADNLRTSPLFSRVTIQSMSMADPPTPTPTPTSTPIATPTMLGAPASPSATAETLKPVASPTATPTPIPQVPGEPTITNREQPDVAVVPVPPSDSPADLTPTASAPPATPTAAPSLNDFVVQDKTESCDLSLPAGYSGDLITGQVIDVDGHSLGGVRLRVASIYTDAPWSAETTSDHDGRFRFYLTKGNFELEVASGTSEVATELWTRSSAEPGVCTWHVVFRKATSRTPTAVATWTPTVTPSPTRSPTITPTPPRGTPVVGVLVTTSSNQIEAALAVDGNVDTMWSAGALPYQYWQETFDNPISVAGVTLVVSQSPEGPTTHTVRLYASNGVEIPAAITLSGHTFDFQELSQAFATPVEGVSTVRVETTSGPSYVAWREIRVIAGPLPTATPSPTATPRTWNHAQPIGIGELQTRTFSYGGDVDWAVFHTAWITGTERVTHTVRAIGGSGIDTDLELREGGGDAGFLAYSNDACPGTHDPLIVQPLKPDTTYYVRVMNRDTTAGSYSLRVGSGALTCDTSASASGSSSVPIDTILLAIRSPEAASGSMRPPGRAAPLGRLVLSPSHSSASATKVVRFTILLDVKTRGVP